MLIKTDEPTISLRQNTRIVANSSDTIRSTISKLIVIMKVITQAIIASLVLFSNTLVAQNQTKLTTENAHIRLLPANVMVTSGYMHLHNTSAQNITIVAASSHLFAKIEIHTHVYQQDMAIMKKVDKVEIAAHSSLKFQPGGYHLMLFNPKAKLKADQVVELQLIDDKNQVHLVNATIKAQQQSHTHHH